MRPLTLGSLFSGSGGFELAGQMHGITPVWASEVEPYPIAVTRSRFPDMKHLGSVSDIHGNQVEPVDILTFGSPCFPAGTLVNTNRGLVPIEQVRITDKVLTHTGNYRQVLCAQYTGTKQLMRLKAIGIHHIDATPNHLFYVKTDKGFTCWKKLSDLSVGDLICAPIIRLQENPMALTGEECWLIGRYIADGYIKTQQRTDRPEGSRFSTVVYCIGNGKEHEFESILDSYSAGKSTPSGGVTKYTVSSHRLTALCAECGVHADNKHFPAFLLNLPTGLLEEVIHGYMSGDGCDIDGLRKATSVSEKLIYTLAQAITKCYEVPCRIYEIPVPEKTVIEGRTVNQKTQWQIVFRTLPKRKTQAYCDGENAWYPVRSVETLPESAAVYDLTVDIDHSFCVQNIAVHNCQDLSVAGAQKGIHEGERSNLFFEAIRIIKEMRSATNGAYPKYAVWENVPGAFSSGKKRDFLAVVQAFTDVCQPGTAIPFPGEKTGWKQKADEKAGQDSDRKDA